MLDLKLAFWETQMHDLYPTCEFQVHFDPVHNQAQIQIKFDNPYDLCHWHLSQNVVPHRTEYVTH